MIKEKLTVLFTFGIITGSRVLNQVIDSIINQNIPEYQIVVVGGSKEWYYDTVTNYLVDKIPIEGVFFKEDFKPRWITKKKNLLLALNSLIPMRLLVADVVKALL